MLLFYPEIASRLDFSRVTFLDKETFTDIPEGKQRESDLVVEVYALDGQVEIILVHIEIEFEWGSDFPGRMFDYYTLLRLRYRLMRTSRLGKVAQKFQSLLALVRSGVDEARLTLLTNMVETYLTLNDQERESFATLVATPDGKEVEMVISVYEERGIEKGVKRGEQKLLLRLIESKFGAVSEDIRLRVEAITDVEAIEQLADALLTAHSLKEMGF